MFENPRLVCLDWDGTLIDSFSKIIECIQITAQDFGLPKRSDQEIGQKIGLSFSQLLHGLYGLDLDIDQFARAYTDYYDQTSLAPLFPGVRETLMGLADRGIILSIVTNKSRAALLLELEGHRLLKVFNSFWVAEEYRPKPSPIMIHHAASAHQVSTHETWMIGDALPDLYAGVHAHCSNVYLVRPIPIPAWVENVKIIEGIHAIPDLIDSNA